MEEITNDILWGIHKEQVILDCFNYPFIGTNKWSKDNPIWHCNVYNKKSPYDAWHDINLISKAVDNLYWIVNKSVKKDLPFIKRIHNAFIMAYQNNDFKRLATEVLNRFTVAKIAPKVTALSSKTFEDIIEQSKVDVSKGIYCPMAGFGGIIQGAKSWYQKHNIDPEGLIEAYDINKTFCDYYGWVQRDVLAQVIETNKVAVACPPFGLSTERWKGTPDNMYYDFHDWCRLIKQHIKAPNYILIGPEQSVKKDNNVSGLFIKKIGVSWYPEYTIKSMGEE